MTLVHDGKILEDDDDLAQFEPGTTLITDVPTINNRNDESAKYSSEIQSSSDPVDCIDSQTKYSLKRKISSNSSLNMEHDMDELKRLKRALSELSELLDNKDCDDTHVLSLARSIVHRAMVSSNEETLASIEQNVVDTPDSDKSDCTDEKTKFTALNDSWESSEQVTSSEEKDEVAEPEGWRTTHKHLTKVMFAGEDHLFGCCINAETSEKAEQLMYDCLKLASNGTPAGWFSVEKVHAMITEHIPTVREKVGETSLLPLPIRNMERILLNWK